MPLVSIKHIEDLSYLDVDGLKNYYPNDIYIGSKILFIILRVFNDQFDRVQIEFNVPFESTVDIKVCGNEKPTQFILDISGIVAKYHIPKNYYLEVAFRYVSTKGRIITLFPGEIRYLNCIELSHHNEMARLSLRDEIANYSPGLVQQYIDQFEPYDLSTKLACLGYFEVAKDLEHSIKRFNNGDIDGSIKFSRKVVEGIKRIPINELIKESNRQDKLKSYICNAFNLLSNFGEHTGTSASIAEAVISKDIAVGLSRYIVTICSD